MGERKSECRTITAGGATSASNSPMVSASAIKGVSASCNLAGCDGKCGICTPPPMPTERMEEVEVGCVACDASGVIGAETVESDGPFDPRPCPHCVGGKVTLPPVPGSLTAARLRLADAAEAWWMANEADHSREWATLLGALAALRTARGV